MEQNHPGSSSLVNQTKQRRPSRSKPRLPLFQRLSFSVGHFLNDAVVGAWISYLLIFQTKVLGMSNRTAGFLWIISSSVDAVLCIAVGYICDNHKFPFLAKYGKRKSFHFLGTILVAGLFPFLMMPCFVCGKDSSEWTMGLYYGSITIVHNIGWAFSQVTHLALIPEIAKRPSEMVELHALRSGFTFLSGIFVYAITWIVLRTDGEDGDISPSQWKDFMEISVIVVGTGCLFSLIFHLGTKEPPALAEDNKETSGSFKGLQRQTSCLSANLPLPDKAVGVFCLYDERDLDVKLAENLTQTEVISMQTIQEEEADKELGVVKDNGVCWHARREVESRVDLEKGECGNEFCFSNPAFRTADEKLDFDSEKTASDFDKNSGIQTLKERKKEKTREDEFSFSNPAYLKEDKVNDEGAISQENDQTVRDSQNEEMTEERQSNRSDCSDLSEGYASAPENDSVNSFECPQTMTTLPTEITDEIRQEHNPVDSATPHFRPRSLSSCRGRDGSFSKGTDTSCSRVSVIIEVATDHEAMNSATSKTWSDWFKTPMFYKISFAYMCARLVQVLNSSYVPLYLTETLRFEKESIAYFPLVILISGVFSSLGAKKLDKMLGDKWTYCLAASLVIGSSAWFYLQSESGRNAAYCAAILVGCGSSVMYVTSLSLAGKLVGDNKESGAFVFASMCILSKVANGGSILAIQESFPTSGGTGDYVRYVFSMGPGAASLLGFLAVIAFLPATMKCRKVVYTADCSVQTEELTNDLYAYDNRAAMDDADGDCKEKEFVTAN